MLVLTLAFFAVAGRAIAGTTASLRGKNNNVHASAVASPTCLHGVDTSGSFAAVCSKPSLSIVSEADILSIAQSVKAELDALLAGMSTSEQAQLFGTAFKLVLHDAAEIDLHAEDLLGPDGCLSNSPLNAELSAPSSMANTVIEPLWQKHCDKISRADFWVLFAKLSLEKADATNSLWLPFQYGRKDAAHCNTGVQRLLNDQRDGRDVFRVFVQQMGLTSSDAVTLMGARSLGMHGSYSYDSTPAVFDNNYYKQLLENAWSAAYDPADRAKNIWLSSPVLIPGDNTHVPYTNNGTLVNFVSTFAPSVLPTTAPSLLPSAAPSVLPTVAPTATPSMTPSVAPTAVPTASPSVLPSAVPTVTPTAAPSVVPSVVPTTVPTAAPSTVPSVAPSHFPSAVPTTAPTTSPSEIPTVAPTVAPTVIPSLTPTVVPSVVPSLTPTAIPSKASARASPTKLPQTSRPSKKRRLAAEDSAVSDRRALQAAAEVTPIALSNVDVSLVYPTAPQFSLYFQEFQVRKGDACGQHMVQGGKGQGCINHGVEVAGGAEHSVDRVKLYAANQDVFLAYFASSFERLTTAGYHIAGYVMPSGKLGTVTPLAL